MAGKENQSPIPLVPNGTTYSRRDEETQRYSSDEELKRKKRIKYLLYFVAFVIFQTAVIAIFTLTIMKVRTPKFRVRSGTFDSLNPNSAGTSFDGTMKAELGVKNPNFGKYKYEDTTMFLLYGETQIGEVPIPGSSVGWRSTKKILVPVNLNSTRVPNSQLGSDLKNGIVQIKSHAGMMGKVKLTFIFNKRKSTTMDCTMDIATATKQLVNISCQ